MECNETKLSQEQQESLEGYVEIFLNSQKMAKENSLDRAIQWFELVDGKFTLLDEFMIITQESPDKFNSVLDFVGILIDINLLNEMKIGYD